MFWVALAAVKGAHDVAGTLILPVACEGPGNSAYRVDLADGDGGPATWAEATCVAVEVTA